jgi:hypothetical protein
LAALPGKPNFEGGRQKLDAKGKLAYLPLLEWRSKELRDRFSQRVVELVARALRRGRAMTDAFDALLDEPRWLAWREEERGGRKTKVPYAAGRQGLGSATDPATWGTHGEAEARARGLQNGSKTGCGIALGDIGDHLYLAGVDLDSSPDENRGLARWAVGIISALGSYAEVSPSGRGLKAFFYLAAEDVRWFLDRIGVESDKWGGKRGIPGLSGSDHGPGIEIYTAARYFTVTHRVWSADHPRIVLLEHDQLDALAGLIPPPAKTGNGASGDGRDTSRSARALRAALAMGAGSFEEMSEGLRRHPDPEIREWVRKKGEASGGRELYRIWDRIDQGEGVRLEDFHAYMPLHKYMFAPARELWPGSSVNARLPRVPLFNSNGTPVLDDDGKQVEIPATAWLDRHKPIEQMTWAPGLPMVIRHRLVSEGGWIERNDVSCFNLYREPLLHSGDPEKAGRWVDHVALIYPEDAGHIIRWFAHRVQHPEQKINHALVLGGLQGIGKDTLFEPVKRAVGAWNVAEPSPGQMTGRFNGFAKSVILRINEAHDLGEFDRYQFYEHLKVYTAAPPDVLRVDEKNLREHNVLNCCGVVITTNYKANGLYLPADDRRHYVAWSHLAKEDFTQDYWDELWRWYEAGGDHDVAAYLAQFDITSFNPKAPPPKTPAFWDIVNAGRAPEDAEMADVLEFLGNPQTITLLAVILKAREEQRHEFADWLGDRRNRRVVPHRFEACGYVPVRNPDADSGLWQIARRRQVVCAKASLLLADQIRAARAWI